MSYLKSAFFYFLAIRINLTKFIKKIYFTTTFYNKSLETVIPKKFYFYPNSFLLSSISNYKNFSFKIKEIDLPNFWVPQRSLLEDKKINSFLWLNLIDRKNDNVIIQKIIALWIYKNPKYREKVWDNSVVSKRVISWILNSEIIYTNTDAYFKENFLKSIVVQTNHLKKVVKFEKNYSKRIEILTAILLTGLVFKEYSENFDFSILSLEDLIEEFFDKDGFPLSRNPSHLLKFSKYFILIKECSNEAQKYIPDFLDDIIEKSLNCLKRISTPENKIPLFNGGTEVEIKEYFNYIGNLNYKIKSINNAVGGLSILKYKKNTVFFDVGEPPKKSYSKAYQCGPLSFEYYYDGIKVVTNCGFGYNISKKAMLLSRLTSAQSTLSINDTSAVKFERNKIANKAFGNSINDSFKIFDFKFEDNNEEVSSIAAHNAYENLFKCNHKRELKIKKDDEVLSGRDELIKTENDVTIKYDIRFHLSPGIGAVRTISGNSALIQLSKNKSLIFTTKNERLSVEKSIFLGENKILNNLCITVSGNLTDKSKNINWEIKKNIN